MPDTIFEEHGFGLLVDFGVDLDLRFAEQLPIPCFFDGVVKPDPVLSLGVFAVLGDLLDFLEEAFFVLNLVSETLVEVGAVVFKY